MAVCLHRALGEFVTISNTPLYTYRLHATVRSEPDAGLRLFFVSNRQLYKICSIRIVDNMCANIRLHVNKVVNFVYN